MVEKYIACMYGHDFPDSSTLSSLLCNPSLLLALYPCSRPSLFLLPEENVVAKKTAGTVGYEATLLLHSFYYSCTPMYACPHSLLRRCAMLFW